MGIDYVYRKKHVRLAMQAYDLLGSTFRKRRPPKATSAPKHVCFVVLHQIGDVVMSLPTIRAVMDALPDAKYSALVGKATAPIFRLEVGEAVEVREFDAEWQYAVEGSNSASNAKERFHRLLADLNPDAVIVFHPDLVVNQQLGKASVPYTFGFNNAGGGFFLTHPMDLPASGHQAERNYVLARAFTTAFGLQTEKLKPPELQPGAHQMEQVRDMLPTGAYVAIHPFGRFNSRNWPAERWREVLAWLRTEELIPVVIGGPKDDAGPYVQGTIAVDLTGKLDLPQTAALLSQCELFIGIDSGPGHIAAAVGCPVISIFSSANVPERWSPYPGRVTVMYSPEIDRTRWPLEARDLPEGTVGNPYADAITPEMVIAVARNVLGRAVA